MHTILIDDEEVARNLFIMQAKDIADIKELKTFADGDSALIYARSNQVDLAILDVDLKHEHRDGIRIGQELRYINPNMMLIYITASEEYALQAIKMHAADYLTKPYSTEELRYAVESARLLSKRKRKNIHARTFGHFDLFVNGEPIMFKSAKAKELLALLIDRQGGTVTTDQIIGTLWEDRPNDISTQNLCSKVGKTLEKELQQYGIAHIIQSSRGKKRVDTEMFSCDLYELLSGNHEVAEQFIGEYMIEYSWAEERMALLDKFA